MSMTRCCRRCDGEEFIMTTESGLVITWTNAAGNERTWFCPTCDWGEDRELSPHT